MTGLESRERDQRRLHAWPAWDDTIRSARERLGYDPAWRPRPGGANTTEYRRWREAVELTRLLAEAHRALVDLHLPVGFRDYWVACFLAPYDGQRFEQILDPMPDGSIRDVRVFPPPPEEWFVAGVDYSTAPATLLIEGPAALASTSVLRAAERRALDAKRRMGFPQQHPYQRLRQIGPAQDQIARDRGTPNEARTNAIRMARDWRRGGEKPWFIAKLLGERIGYKVSPRQVSRWVEGVSHDRK